MKFNDKEYEYTQVIRAYEILGVPLCSDYHSITKKAFYRLAKQFHPDRHLDNPKLAAKKFTKVGAAKDYLEKFRDEIERDKDKILKFAKNPVIQQPDLPSQNAAAPETPVPQEEVPVPQEKTKPPKEDKNCGKEDQEEEENCNYPSTEEKRREREFALCMMKIQLDQILNILPPISIPDDLSIESIYLASLHLLNSMLLLEVEKVDVNLRRFISDLSDKKARFQYEFDRINNYLPSFLFEYSNHQRRLKKEQLAEVIGFFANKIDKLTILLKQLNFLTQKIQITSLSEQGRDLLLLNEIINKINDEIANIQCTHHYHSELANEKVIVITPKELILKNITRLTENFLNYKDLQVNFSALNLSRNVLFKISGELKIWDVLEKIEIVNSPLVGFPEFLCKMSNLKTLILQGNAITQLPKSIGNLSQLTTLDLSNNFLSQLPDSFDYLESLQVLNLKDNRFANIPTMIGVLSHLRELNFENSIQNPGQGNNLTAIPVELFSLSNLEILNLNQNNILFLPEKVVSNWNKLHTLNIRNNLLSALPKNIGDLQSLRVIDAQENQILFIPASILKLKASLQHCFLNNNLLHHNPLQVQAILILMGTPLDQIKCLLELQTPTEITPMCMEDGTALEDDSDLTFITQDFKKYIDDLAQRQYLGFLFDMKEKERQAAVDLNGRSSLPEVACVPLGY